MSRFLKLGVLCLLTSLCLFAEDQVQIQDHLMLGANDTPASGTISLSNLAFAEQDGTQVAASTISVTVNSDGSFTLSAYPTTAATYTSGASGPVYYTARFYTASGSAATEKWYVPEPGTSGITFPLTLQELLKPSPLNIPVLTAVPSTCTVGAEIVVNGAEYLCTATNVYSQVPLTYQQLSGTPNSVLQSQVGQANGVAALDANALLLSSEIPAIPYGKVTGSPDLSQYLTQSQIGTRNGVAQLDGNQLLPLSELPPIPFANLTNVPSYLPLSSVGQPNGAASLDTSGKVPTAQIPAIPYSGLSGAPPLSPVATNGGDYNSLINKPTLGTAAGHAATDFLASSGLGVANGVASLDGNGHVPITQLPPLPLSQILGLGTIAGANSSDYLATSSLNAPNGAAELDANRLLLASELPPITAGQVTGLPTTLPPSGVAGGDLVGSYPNPTVKGLNGTTLSSLGAGLLKQNGSGIPAIATNQDVQQAIGYTPADVAKNLGDLTNPAAARTALGLGSASTQNSTAFLPDPGSNGLIIRTAPGVDTIAQASDVNAALGFTPANAGLIGQKNGIAALDTNSQVPLAQIPNIPFTQITNVPAFVPQASVGVVNGIASLDNTAHVPTAQIPAQPLATTALPGEIIVGNSLQISTGGNGNPAAGTLDVKAGQYDLAGAATTAQGNSLQKTANLGDVADKTAALNNLGVQSAGLHPATDFVASGNVGVANGVASLDNTIKVPIAQIPPIPLGDIPGLGTIASHAAGDYVASATVGQKSGVAGLDANGLVSVNEIPPIPVTDVTGLGTAATQPATNFVAQAEVGAANGVASLDATSKVPVAQIPSLPYSVINDPPPISLVGHSGNYTDLLDAPTALPPNGPAGGDLAGNFPSPTVTALNGTKLSTLGAGLLSQNVQGIPAIAGPTAVTASLGYTPMNPALNLGDVSDKPTARGVLGLGTSAIHAATDFLSDSGTNGLVVRTGAGTTDTAKSADVIGVLGYTPLNPTQINVASGIAGLDVGGKVPVGEIPNIPYANVTNVPAFVLSSLVGAANGVAPLDGSGHVPSTDLPAQTLATATTPGQVLIGSGFIASDAANGKLSVDGTLYDKAGAAQTVATASIPTSAEGVANGVAILDNSTHVPVAQIPNIPYTQILGAPTSLPPGGPAAGDLGGTYPTPTVTGLNGQNLKALGAGVLAQSVNGIPRLATNGDALALLGFTPINSAQIGVASGVAGLDATAKVPLAQIPTIPYTQISNPPVIPPQYVLPVASPTILGGMMTGPGLSENAAGLVSANFGTAAGTVMEGNDARVTGAVPSSALGQPNGVATLNAAGLVPANELGPAQSVANTAVLAALGFTPANAAQINAASGIAGLDATTHVPLAEIPNIPYTQLSGAPTLGTIAVHAATDYVLNTNAGVTAALGFTPVNATALGIANGVATLDATDHLTTAQLPTAIPYTNLADAPANLPPSGAATGDLAGQYPAPTVAGLNGQNLKALGPGVLMQDKNGVPALAGAPAITAALGFTPLSAANVNVANGIAGLDATTKVPLAQIPTIPYTQLSGTPVIPPAYALPIATNTVLGGLMLGTGLAADATGLTSVQYGTIAGTAAAGNDSRIANALQASALGQANGIATLNTAGVVPATELGPAQSVTNAAVLAALTFTPVNSALVGQKSGLATLDTNGFVPSAEVPPISYTGLTNTPVLGTIASHAATDYVANTNAGVVTALGFAPVPNTALGIANGVATLDNTDHLTAAQLPTAIPYASITNAPTGLPPTGAATGDLGGTYPAPTVAGLNGQNLKALGAGLLMQNGNGIPAIAGATAVSGALGYAPLAPTQIGAANGVAGLDATSKVALANLPQIPYTQISNPPIIPPAYALPIATNTVLGGLILGTGLTSDATGLTSVQFGTTLGTVAQGNDTRITGAVQQARIGQPSGVAGLDANGLVPNAQLGPAQATTLTAVTAALGYTPVNPNVVGTNSGIAELDVQGKLPTTELPQIPTSDIVGLPNFGDIVTHNAAEFVLNNNAAIVTALGFSPMNVGARGSANGVASLDANSLVPVAQIPPIPYSSITNPPVGLPPTGPATGDLGGTYPAPKVVALNGTNLVGLGAGLLQQNVAGIPSIANAAALTATLGYAPANSALLGATNGIATLDGTTHVPLAQLPQIPYTQISNPPVIPPQYVLPVATNTVLGGIELGTGLSANASGVASVNYGVGQGTAAQGNDTRLVNAVQTVSLAAPGGVATLDGSGHVPLGQLPTNALVTAQNIDVALGYAPLNPNLIGASGGIAALDATTHVPIGQIPTIPSTNITGLPTFGDIVTHNAADFVANNQTAVISALGFTPVNTSSVGSASGIATLDANKLVPLAEIPSGSIVTGPNVINGLGYTPLNPNQIGAVNGLASLDGTGHVPVGQIPMGIPAPNIDQGEVSNIAFSYLAGVTSPIQAQFGNTLHFGAGSSGGVPANTANLNTWNSATANAGSVAANAVVIGDSIACCIGPTNYSNVWTNLFRKHETGKYGNHGSGIQTLGANGGNALKPEWTMLNGEPVNVVNYGPYQNGTGASGALFQIPPGSQVQWVDGVFDGHGDHFNVYWASAPDASASCQIFSDNNLLGTLPQQIGSYQAQMNTYAIQPGTGQNNYSGSGNSFALKNAGTSGNCYLYGVETTNGSSGVSIHNLAHGYFRSEAFGSDVNNQLAYLNLIPGGIQLAILSLGVNDAGNGTGVTTAQYQQNMQNIINYLKGMNPSMSIVILDENDTAIGDAGSPMNQTQMRGVEMSLATSDALNYYSVEANEGNLATEQANGWITGDNTHPTDAGDQEIASLVDSYFDSGGGNSGASSSGGGNSLSTGAGAVYYSGSGTTLQTVPMNASALQNIADLSGDAQTQLNGLTVAVAAAVHPNGSVPISVTTGGSAPNFLAVSNSPSGYGNAMFGVINDTSAQWNFGAGGSTFNQKGIAPNSFFIYDTTGKGPGYASFYIEKGTDRVHVQSNNSDENLILSNSSATANAVETFENDKGKDWNLGSSGSNFSAGGILPNSFFIYDVANSEAPFQINPSDQVQVVSSGTSEGLIVSNHTAADNAVMQLDNGANLWDVGAAGTAFSNAGGVRPNQYFVYDVSAARAAYTISQGTDNTTFIGQVSAVGGFSAPSMTLTPQGSPPSCSSANQGELWNQTQSGSPDQVLVCQSDGSGGYSWQPFRKGVNNAAILAGFINTLHNANSQVVNVVVAGDSIAVCYTGDTELCGSTATYPSAQSKLWVNQLKSYLQSEGYFIHGTGMIPVYAGQSDGTYTISGSFSPQATGGPGADSNDPQIYVAGSTGSGCSSSTATITMASEYGDHVNIYYLVGSITGPGFDVQIDGSDMGIFGNETYSSGVAPRVASIAAPGGLGNHTVTISGANCTAFIYALEWTTGTVGVEFHNWSLGGRAYNFYGANPSNDMDFLSVIPGGVQLLIPSALTNYMTNPGVNFTPTQLSSTLDGMVKYAQGLSSSVFVLDEPAEGSNLTAASGNGYTQNQYRAAQFQTVRKDKTGYLSMYDRWGPYASATAKGFVNTSDKVHPTDAGQADMAAAVESAVFTGGPSAAAPNYPQGSGITNNSALTEFASALSNSKNQVVNIVVLGDSLSVCTQSVCSSGPTTEADLWPYKMAADLQATYGNHGSGIIPLVVGPNNQIRNDYWSASNANLNGQPGSNNNTGPSQVNSLASNGLMQVTATADGGGMIMDGLSGDAVHLYYSGGPGACDITVYNLSGGNVVIPNPGGSYGILRWDSPPQPYGDRRIGWGVPNGCSEYIYGADVTTGSTGVEVHNLGRSAARSEWFAPGAKLSSVLTAIPGQINLVLMMFGSNEFADGGYFDPNTYYGANLQSMISAIKALSPIPSIGIFDPPNFRMDGANSSGVTMQQYRNVETQIASSSGAAYASVADHWGTVAQATSAGLLNPGPDYHDSNSGGLSMASIAEAAFVPSGVTVAPASGSGSGNNNGGVGSDNGAPTQIITSNYQATASDGTLLVIGGYTITLPSSPAPGQIVTVVNLNPSGTNETIQPPSGAAIDNDNTHIDTLPGNGGSNLPTYIQYQYYQGTQNSWWIIDRSPTN